MEGPVIYEPTHLAPGDYNRHYGEILQECQGFIVPSYNIPLMELTNVDSRTWIPEFVRIFFDDGAYVECPVDVAIGTNSQAQVDTCTLMVNPC